MKIIQSELRPGMKYVLSLLFTAQMLILHAQQTITFTQYMNNGSLYNPSYSTINGRSEINLTGKSQWTGIDGAPKSYMLNGNLYLERINSSAGMVIRQDKFGAENQTTAMAFFSKSIGLGSRTFLATSLSAGFGSFQANYSQLDATDPLFSNDLKESTALLGLGVMAYRPEKFYVGISMPALRLKNSANAMKSALFISGGYLYKAGENILLKPALLLTAISRIPLTADFSTTAYFGSAGVGLNYNTNQEVGGILTYMLHDLKMGYSYQAPLSNRRIGTMGSGTHEITFGFYLRDKKEATIRL